MSSETAISTGSDRQAGERDHVLQWRQSRRKAAARRPRSRGHSTTRKAERQQGHRADQDVGDRFQPQQPPRPRLDCFISTVEADPAAPLSRPEEEIKRQNGSRPSAKPPRRRHVQHIMHLAGKSDWRRSAARRQRSACSRFVREVLRPSPPAPWRKIRNGNSEVRVDRARDMAGDGPGRRRRETADRRHSRRRRVVSPLEIRCP